MFGDYERDEEDCSLTKSQMKMGNKCARAYMEMPLVDITPHPEYSRLVKGECQWVLAMGLFNIFPRFRTCRTFWQWKHLTGCGFYIV